MYTVYHAPQLKKVGCTSKWPARAISQDLDPPFDQYVKFKTSSIDEASFVEAELRKFYGYKEDSPFTYKQKFGKNMNKKSKHSPTPSVGWNELKAGSTGQQLLADMNRYCCVELSADGFSHTFYPEAYGELVSNAKTSQYKDFYWQVTTLKKIAKLYPNEKDCKTVENGPCSSHGNNIPEFQQIRDWATTRGIYEKGDPKTQLIKLIEEQGEFAKAILKNDEPEIIDALGDMLVVLINLSELAGYKLEDCLASAYEVISKRSGKMINGTFVKTESL